MAFRNPSDDVLRDIWGRVRRSHRIARFLIAKGHDVVPVNPCVGEVLDRVCYPSVRDVPGPIDMVDVFRRSDVAEVVEQAIEKGAKIVWTRLGIGDERAAAEAQAAGLTVVMDRCPAIEYRRLL
jgi:predicted CoA-binding protein